MSRTKRTASIAAGIVLLSPSLSEGAGLITGLTASPNPAQVSQDVTFAVKGTSGGCGDLTIDFGDGQSTKLAPVSFNNNTNTTATHKYAAATTYTAKATPGKGCTGTAAVSVTVGGGGTGGTGGTGATGGGMVSTYRPGLRNLIRQVPLIEELYQFSSVLPGGSVLVKGRYFGDRPGQFRLKLSSGLVTNLSQLTWQIDAVSGIIDPNISGVTDQDAKLQLVDANGTEGNEWPVTFTAKREIKVLPGTDIQCSTEQKGGRDRCNSVNQAGYDGGYSLQGAHGCTGFLDPLTGCYAAGQDTFWTTLANGWRVRNVVMDRECAGNHVSKEENIGEPNIIDAGPGPVKITVDWDTGDFYACYYARAFIQGPAGTPHR